MVKDEKGVECGHPIFWSGRPPKPQHSNMWTHLVQSHKIQKLDTKSSLVPCNSENFFTNLTLVRIEWDAPAKVHHG